MRARFAAALAVIGLITISCGGITDPSKNTVDTFTGTVGVGGSTAHAFTAANGGELTVRITALAPISSIFVGIEWTQAANDGSCAGNLGVLAQSLAQLNVPVISGASIISGKYCIVVYDPGTLSAAENYTLTVSHP